MPSFPFEGVDFYFEQSGEGPPVVLCHGLTGDLTQIQELLSSVPGHSLLLWDCRGHGRTEPLGPSQAFEFPQFSRDLHAFLTHLNISQAVVGGFSMGAGVATRFALDHSEMVSGLILIRPAWLDLPNPGPLRMGQQIGELLASKGAKEGRKVFEQSIHYQQLKSNDPWTANAMCEQFEKPQAAERSVRLQRMPASCPIRNWNEVARLIMPALVAGCEPDFVHPYEVAVEWAQRLPNATLVKVPPRQPDVCAYKTAVRSAIVEFVCSL